MIRPFLAKMTKSELHAICTGGFATVAGSTMGGYIAYKVHVTTWFNKNPQQILQILILQQKTYSRRCNNWSLVESSAKCVEKLRFFRLKCLLCSFLWQVPANHLLSASVMSAPAALAMAKLFYPETKKTKTGNEVYNIPSGYLLINETVFSTFLENVPSYKKGIYT